MMDEMMKQLMAKKGANSKMSPEDAQAKLDVIKELLEMATQAMGSKVKGGMDEMQKVSIMAPDKESLLQGLDMAQDVASEDAPEDDTTDELGSAEETPETPEDSEEPKEDASELSGLEAMGMKKKKRPLFSMMDDED